jgi:DNA-binding transcriptional regulator YiaG
MPNVAKVLREETLRLARKETRVATSKLRKDSVSLKRTVADFRRRIARLEHSVRELTLSLGEQRKQAVQPSDDELKKARVSGKMVRTIRARLKLTQAELGLLLGVTPVTVWLWEKKEGRIGLRGASKAAVLAARKMRRTEAAKRIEELKRAATARAARKPRRRGRRK